MGLPQVISGGVGLGTSLIGSLFGKKERGQDKQARQMQMDAMKQQGATAEELRNYYKQLVGMGQDYAGTAKESWNTASPIYQNLLGQYNQMQANPYAYVAPQIEDATRAGQAQQQAMMSQYGRGAAQQYGMQMANSQLPVYGQQAMQQARMAGMEGQGNIGNVYQQRANSMFSLASNTFGQAQGALGGAGSTYANLANTAGNWKPYQSPWGQVIGQAGQLAGSYLMGMPSGGGENIPAGSGWGNVVEPPANNYGWANSGNIKNMLFPKKG